MALVAEARHLAMVHARVDLESRWAVFGADGRLRTTVTGPAGLRLLDVGDDYVLAHWIDEVDAERVRLYRLER